MPRVKPPVRAAVALPVGAVLGGLCGLVGVAALGVVAAVLFLGFTGATGLRELNPGSSFDLTFLGAFGAGAAIGAAAGLAQAAAALAADWFAALAFLPRLLRALLRSLVGGVGAFAALSLTVLPVLPDVRVVGWFALLPAVAAAALTPALFSLTRRIAPLFRRAHGALLVAAAWLVCAAAALAALVAVSTVVLSFQTGGATPLDPACRDLGTGSSSWGTRIFPPRVLCSPSGSTELYATVPPALDDALVIATITGAAALVTGLTLFVWAALRSRRPDAPPVRPWNGRRPTRASAAVLAATALAIVGLLVPQALPAAAVAARGALPEFTLIGDTSQLVPQAGAAGGHPAPSPSRTPTPLPVPSHTPGPLEQPSRPPVASGPLSRSAVVSGSSALVRATRTAIGPWATVQISTNDPVAAPAAPALSDCGSGGTRASWSAFIPWVKAGGGQDIVEAVVTAWQHAGYGYTGAQNGVAHYGPRRSGLPASDLSIVNSETDAGILITLRSVCSEH